MAGDATPVIQKCIDEGCKTKKSPSEWVTIKMQPGNFPITVLRIPNYCKIAIFSEEKSKLIHLGKKKEPLFILGEKSLLKLQNLTIDYRGKELFMIHGHKRNPDNVFMENVKINRLKGAYLKSEENNSQLVEPVSPEQLLKFIKQYVESYRKEANLLIGEPPAGAGYPPSVINRVYIDSKRIRGYLLKDAIVIADVVEPVVSSEGFEPDRSIEIFPAQLTERLSDGTQVEIVLTEHSLQNFIFTATLGLFKPEAAGTVNEYGRHGGLRKFTIQNPVLKKERHVSQIDLYPYLDKAGWEPKNAWIYAFYDVRYDIASAIATQEEVGQTYEVDGGGKITATPTDQIWREYDKKIKLGSKLARFSKDIEDFEHLLIECKSAPEQRFLDYLDNHLHLLDIYAVSIESQPFLEIPEEELSTIKGVGRLPDYIARYRDDSYVLIELERPSEPIFVGKEKQPSHELTQSVNQVSIWDEIIRCFGNYLKKYQGVRNHRNLVVIGRESAQRFNSPEEFRAELNRINQQYKNTTVITFDELVERAKVAVARIRAIQSSLG